MRPAMARVAARASSSPVNHAARLELLEYYLVHHEDLAGCAAASLDWLARHTGLRRAVCLAVDGESSVLAGIAGYGVAEQEVEYFSWPLSDTRDRLVAALTSSSPTEFR